MSEMQDEQETLVNKQINKKSTSIVDLSVKLLAALCILITLILISINMAVSYDIQNHMLDKPKTEQRPRAFGVHLAGTVRDQESRGTCWDFATMRFLEERYRAQGIKQGKLAANKFVRFSEQAHGVNIINYCKANPSKCPDTPGAKGIATDGYPSWIYHFQKDLNNKLTVDLPSCPYVPTESVETDDKCPGMKEFQAKNRIQYNVKSYQALYSLDDIKTALWTKNQSFPLSTELMWMEYFVPCEINEIYKQTKICTEKQRKCPQDQQNELFNRYCFVTSLMTTAEAEFVAKRNRRDPTLGAHAMLLVGYNDDYTMKGQTTGGLIVQNSWGPVLGHSLDFLLGKISRRQEQQICPNVNSPYEWVPIDNEGEDKYKLRRATVLKYFPESSKPGHFHTADKAPLVEALKLVEKLKENYYYVVKQIDESIDGTVEVKLGITPSADPMQDFTKITDFVTLPPMPYDLLAFFFAPINTNADAANEEDCGYYFIPYDFVTLVNRVQGLWAIDLMEVEFTESSYVNSNKKQDGDDEILKATHEQKVRKIESHTPWLDDERNHPRFK